MSGQAWAPQSPDLSGLRGGSYAPRSPDLSAYKAKVNTGGHHNPQTSAWSPRSPDIAAAQHFHGRPGQQAQPSHFSLETGWDTKSPAQSLAPSFAPASHAYTNTYPPPPTPQQGLYYGSTNQMPAQLRSHGVKKEEDGDWTPSTPYDTHRQAQQFPIGGKSSVGQAPRRMDTKGVEVKTKFPTARIKRIMQADEDVGKVAQVTPVVMAKALELFMISLITASADVAKSKNSKRVQTSHLKAVVMQDEQFDNLREIMERVPDAPPKKSGRDVADSDSDEHNGEGGSSRKRKKSSTGRGKKRRGSDDDF